MMKGTFSDTPSEVFWCLVILLSYIKACRVNFCRTFISNISLFLELAVFILAQTLLNPPKLYGIGSLENEKFTHFKFHSTIFLRFQVIEGSSQGWVVICPFPSTVVIVNSFYYIGAVS